MYLSKIAMRIEGAQLLLNSVRSDLWEGSDRRYFLCHNQTYFLLRLRYNKRILLSVILRQNFTRIIRGNLSEERFRQQRRSPLSFGHLPTLWGVTPEPPSKDFNTNFSQTGHTENNQIFVCMICALSDWNFILKVLGKEFEEEPFFKRVFSNNARRVPIEYHC